MTEEVECKTCCGCLKKGVASTMYYFNDPAVLSLFQECTNIWIEEDQYVPQQLCALCYKQCEVAKYFKEQCEASFSKVINKKLVSCKKKKAKKHNRRAPAPVNDPRKEAPEEPFIYPVIDEEPLVNVAVQSHPQQHDFFEEDPEEDQGKDEEDYQEEANEDSEEPSEYEPMEDDASYEPTQKKRRALPPTKHFDTSTLDPAAALALPEGPRKTYISSYGHFRTWKGETGAGATTEDVLLDYFKHLVLVRQYKSVEQMLSHLKPTLQVYEGISIGEFDRLKKYVRERTNQLVRTKAPEMTKDHLVKFMRRASDEQYITEKMIVALWLAGCIKGEEIYELKLSHVFDRGTHMEVLGTRNGQYFIKPSVEDRYNPVPTVRQYLAEADADCPWLLRAKGQSRCGLKRIQTTPKVVAKFLRLRYPNNYTMFSVRQDRRDRRV